MLIWLDLENLIRHVESGHRPSGIQRVTFELSASLVAAGGGAVRVCRHARAPHGFVELDWADVEARLAALMTRDAPARRDAPSPRERPEAAGALRRAFRRLPDEMRIPVHAVCQAEHEAARGLRSAGAAQLKAMRGLAAVAAGGWRLAAAAVRLRVLPRRRGVRVPDAFAPPVAFAAGDVLLAIGATWPFPDYAARIDAARRDGVRFAPFVYDLVPALFPEWSARSTTTGFRTWMETVLPQADRLFTISHATRRALRDHAKRAGLPIPEAIPVPVGAHFPRKADPDAAPLHPRPYVLFVSTIEPRKNHAGMLRLWREMIMQEKPDLVPDLILAGRIGWMSQDFITQCENAGWLGGKLRLIESPTDAELAILYRDCLFTIYPSFYEGWGLPVTESLGFGKPVVASNTAAIPEAGGRFCIYFDPNDLGDARRAISGLVRNPSRRAGLEADIARNYRPPSWPDAARLILDVLADDAVDLPAAPAVISLPAPALSSPTG
ncbi:glycosyltransferase [Acidiphilium multivorum]|uniref:glycosyltransferase n=1 Tax=Acidiphilium multivorum TaxID=62140 RepID=UPI0039C95D2C